MPTKPQRHWPPFPAQPPAQPVALPGSTTHARPAKAPAYASETSSTTYTMRHVPGQRPDRQRPPPAAHPSHRALQLPQQEPRANAESLLQLSQPPELPDQDSSDKGHAEKALDDSLTRASTGPLPHTFQGAQAQPIGCSERWFLLDMAYSLSIPLDFSLDKARRKIYAVYH